ncbi:uncharacterized protein EI90DRAFT_3043235 [Cantharellus anzutake]|uniref:uncharacterized protein n=1 Tax=Cantharellus anzutake TaxID=1750568 RepID=UPI001904FFE2|nr:uncharacterized protein EI90DRAFT_3043235 [Cantharellus anzutake]KAF8337517.1 hypothetical protein EI90DRAFT_3043235 [Cantharellus anzutake]
MDADSALLIARLLQEDLYGSTLWTADENDPSGSEDTPRLVGDLAEFEMMSSADAAFARRLQALYDNRDTPDGDITGASLLGVDFWQKRPRDKGSGAHSGAARPHVGKAKSQAEPNMEGKVDPPHLGILDSSDAPLAPLLLTRSPKLSPPSCLICLEDFNIAASLSGTLLVASSKALYGRLLSCPQKHPFCYPCLQHLIRSKLERARKGEGVFPIRCPSCPNEDWSIREDDAELLLDAHDLREWRRIAELESRPKFYCPERHCSELIFKIDGQTQMDCPRCGLQLCSTCESRWHAGLNCEQYQSLSLHERSPDDLLFFTVMVKNKWRRCPKCGVVIQRGEGCRHIVCRCGTQFCYRCSNLWDLNAGKCGGKRPCDLWSEEELLRHDMEVHGPVVGEIEG